MTVYTVKGTGTHRHFSNGTMNYPSAVFSVYLFGSQLTVVIAVAEPDKASFVCIIYISSVYIFVIALCIKYLADRIINRDTDSKRCKDCSLMRTLE